MQIFKQARHLFLALACTAPLMALAQPGPDGPPPFMQQRPSHGEHRAGLPFLHGVDLDEAQQDKVFAIMHANAPRLRELEKERRKAEQGLAELGMSGRFDDSKARSLGAVIARATGEIALIRSRGDSEIVALLRPDQRDRMMQRERREARDTRNPPQSR